MSVAAVIDFGSGVIKAGWAGEDAPATCFRAVVGEPKFARVLAGGALAGVGEGSGGLVCGAAAAANAGLLRLWPAAGGPGGSVSDWRAAAALLAHAYGPAALQAAPGGQPLLLTEPPQAAARAREETAAVAYETLGVPALLLAATPTLALYGAGRTTGLVLDVGDSSMTATPICEGELATRDCACSDDRQAEFAGSVVPH